MKAKLKARYLASRDLSYRPEELVLRGDMRDLCSQGKSQTDLQRFDSIPFKGPQTVSLQFHDEVTFIYNEYDHEIIKLMNF